ncbi:MAG: glycosyltransferase [Chitinivibrionales bacterium]|nr:glycosyltransferase [Chitinivibrionales bacterium]
MKLSIVVPLFNEEDSLRDLTKAIDIAIAPRKHEYEIVFVDDGSTDHSPDICKELHGQYPQKIKMYRFSRNYGKSAALSLGIEKASGDTIITMDADLQDDPSAIPSMLEKLNEGYDVVSGWKKRRKDPITKTFPSLLYNGLTRLVSGVKIHDFNCGFKAYRAPVAKTLEIYGERHRYLPVLAHWDGYRVAEVVVPHHPRKYGKSKFGISRATGMFDLLTLLFLRKYMRKPLHFFGLLGLILFLAGSTVLGYFGIQWLITGEMHVRPLVLLSVGAIIMGIQFVSIGLIGEMITHSVPKHRYSVRESIE